MEELVSIITPTYNCEKFIEETIKSVINQTYKNWEMIITDDCSKDNTQEIVENYSKNDDRIKYYRFETNQGAAEARNHSLRLAQGKYIAFLDSDDLWEQDKLEKQIHFMKVNDYNFTYTKYREIDEDSKKLNRIISGPKKISIHGMYNYCYPGCLTVMYNAEQIGLIQIENIPKNNDYAIWLKVIKKAKYCYLLDEVLAFYRKRTNSISSGNKFKLIRHHYILYRIGEKRDPITSIILTIRNMFFGVIKKMRYIKGE